MHCRHFIAPPQTRREMLLRCAGGFGAVAAAALLGDTQAAAEALTSGSAPAAGHNPLAPRAPHHRARAKSVIFLFMDGGPSQVDTFDPKPRLDREHGQPIKMQVPKTQFANVGNVLKSPWRFRPRGASGIPVSDLFPAVAECVDDLAVVRSMVAQFSEHTSANYFLHTGHGMPGRPSMGAWTTYGLGSESQNLPGFIVLDSGMIPPGGQDCFHSAFLPATYQGSMFRHGPAPVPNLQRTEATDAAQRAKLELVRGLDRSSATRLAGDDGFESAIENFELAYRMQTAVPDLIDLSGETAETHALYGLDQPQTAIMGRQCLLARRLVERGVRFIEVLCPEVDGDRWDQHSNLVKGHELNAGATDRPIAGLLQDLKRRGLLDETLVVWGGEFGRTPMAQGSDGRDHNPFGYTMWLAGGGVRGGTIHGETDDYGYYAIRDKVEIHDLHATMLHLLGMDHTRLTYRFSGRDMRLTDVHGNVVTGILA
ncbi:MAG: DUF1501 domain-containing protein [Planctomycetaceae bacterium]|nr:DUF1501 domain-containing protein [Planctomycetaceae bacterium]